MPSSHSYKPTGTAYNVDAVLREVRPRAARRATLTLLAPTQMVSGLEAELALRLRAAAENEPSGGSAAVESEFMGPGLQ